MQLIDFLIPALLLLSLLPLGMAIVNRARFQAPPEPDKNRQVPQVSILIPARNEQENIGAAIETCLSSLGADIEIRVLDDHSEDNTRLIVEDFVRKDKRVHLHSSKSLPDGWSGKQYACHQLSQLARYDHFLFLDADVRVANDCIARVAQAHHDSGVSLMSGFPQQITETWMEWLVLPLIHFVLLGYLPFGRMRRSLSPAASAGCGQFFFTDRASYEKAGGHASIKDSSHDGVQLPRSYRRAGLASDLCDITELAQVRMYHNAREVWQGLAKNATEGIGNPKTILPMTVLLLAQVIPLPLLIGLLFFGGTSTHTYLLALICLLNFFNRLILTLPFKLPIVSWALHPVGVTLLLIIQWQALLKKLLGLKTNWKGRQV